MLSRSSILLLSGLLLTSCSGAIQNNTPTPDSTSVGSGLDSTSEASIDVKQPEQTTLEIAYIALNDNGVSGPLVGCGDSEVLVEDSAFGATTTKARVQSALGKLFANKDQYLGESGLYNALYQSTLTVDSVTVDGKTVDVEISGETLSAGECDDPRMVDQIRATVENNLDSDKKFIITININGKPLEKIQDLSGQ